jgi:hypothetical protein
MNKKEWKKKRKKEEKCSFKGCYSFSKHQIQLGMVAHICNPTLKKLKQNGSEFQASLGYIVRPCRMGENTHKMQISFYDVLLSNALPKPLCIHI